MLGGPQQQRRGVAAPVLGVRDLSAQQVHSGAPELIQRSRLRGAQQIRYGVERARMDLGLRRGQRPLRAPRRIGCQHHGPLQEGGATGPAAAGLRSVG